MAMWVGATSWRPDPCRRDVRHRIRAKKRADGAAEVTWSPAALSRPATRTRRSGECSAPRLARWPRAYCI